MKKMIILTIMMTYSMFLSSQNATYQYDDKRGVFYEKILNFPYMSKNDLHEKIKKYLIVNGFEIRYTDDAEIYATGKFPTRFRFVFLIFFKILIIVI